MRIHQIDAFTAQPFAGNPAAVCLLPRLPVASWMQAVAREMNLSETAFLARREDGFELRWFTPEVEVELCGHATLASAHFLWEEEELAGDREARFHTRSGWLTATRKQDWIEMDFPAEKPEEVVPPPLLVTALGAEPRFVGRNRFDYLLELESEQAVLDARPDFQRLRQVDCRGVIITSVAESRDYDFVSRFFAPAAGVDEDPVTGSAHCCLGPFWSSRLGRVRLTGYQASRRGGIVQVESLGRRVLLAGQAVTVLRAELTVALPRAATR